MNRSPFDPRIGRLHMTESRILPSGTHRLKFEQRNQVPDVEEIKKRHHLNDGRYVFSAAWMDEQGIGHAQLAWKENLPQIGDQKEK